MRPADDRTRHVHNGVSTETFDRIWVLVVFLQLRNWSWWARSEFNRRASELLGTDARWTDIYHEALPGVRSWWQEWR